MALPNQKLEIMGIRHCYIEYNNTGSLAFKRVWLTSKCEIKISNAKLEFSGDGQKWHKMYGYEAEGTIEAAVDDTVLDGILWPVAPVSPVTTPVPDDFTVRFIKGSAAEMASNFVGVRITLDAQDGDTGAAAVIRYRILRCQFDPDQVVPVETQKNTGRMLSFASRIATKDVAGASLTGMPTTGAFWVKDIISDATKFDPVAEVY